MSRKCLSLLSLVFVVVSLVRSFVFSGRWLRQIHLERERVMSLSKSLSQNDVNELVLEYLATSGFSEAENTLRKELRGKTKPVAAAASTSRLEDLLEKSYVTQVASGEYFPRKKNRRSHLDAMLMPQDVEIEAPEKSTTSIDTQIISYNAAEGDPYGASVMPLYQTATFAQPGATEFGPYDYTRSGNPTRDSLQKQIAQMDGGASFLLYYWYGCFICCDKTCKIRRRSYCERRLLWWNVSLNVQSCLPSGNSCQICQYGR